MPADFFFFFNDTATTEIYTLSLHDALPISPDKSVIGTASVLSDPYPDPKDSEGKLVVVELQAVDRLKKRVPLQALRENKKLSGMTFLKIQRIAVSPVSKAEFDEIVRMGNSS